VESGIRSHVKRKAVDRKAPTSAKNQLETSSMPNPYQLHWVVNNCSVTLNFRPEASDSIITEIKHMILVG
jgi:hypothetical protein